MIRRSIAVNPIAYYIPVRRSICPQYFQKFSTNRGKPIEDKCRFVTTLGVGDRQIRSGNGHGLIAPQLRLAFWAPHGELIASVEAPGQLRGHVMRPVAAHGPSAQPAIQRRARGISNDELTRMFPQAPEPPRVGSTPVHVVNGPHGVRSLRGEREGYATVHAPPRSDAEAADDRTRRPFELTLHGCTWEQIAAAPELAALLALAL